MARSRAASRPSRALFAHRRSQSAIASACLGLAALLGLLPVSPAYAVSLTFGDFALESGTDKQVGAVYRFDDVTTGVDSLISIDFFSPGAGISKIDDSSVPSEGKYEYFQPVVEGIASDGDYATFTMTFVLADTSTSTSIADFFLRAHDVDGNNVSGNSYEFLNLRDFDSYTIDDPTNISPQPLGPDWIKFKSILNGGPPGITLDPEYTVALDYTAISSVSFQLGLEGTRITTQGRQFAMNMFDDPDPFIDPQITAVPEPGTAFLLLAAAAISTLPRRRRQ